MVNWHVRDYRLWKTDCTNASRSMYTGSKWLGGPESINIAPWPPGTVGLEQQRGTCHVTSPVEGRCHCRVACPHAVFAVARQDMHLPDVHPGIQPSGLTLTQKRCHIGLPWSACSHVYGGWCSTWVHNIVQRRDGKHAFLSFIWGLRGPTRNRESSRAGGGV